MTQKSDASRPLSKVTILVRIREGILDPQGQAVGQALHDMGENDVFTIRIGKIIEIVLPTSEDTEDRVRKWCDRILSNPLVETYEIQSIEPVRHQPTSV
jgi:phosphoribosylformylglycinamidine synthase PurS subunit